MATAALPGPDREHPFRLAPVTLARIPLLRIEEAESLAWNAVRALFAAQRRLDATMARLTPAVEGRLAHERPMEASQIRPLKALRHAVRDGRRPNVAVLRPLAGLRSARLVTRAWQRRDRLQARIAAALAEASAIDAAELAALGHRPEWKRALMAAYPEVAAQAERVLAREGLARRDRITLRTLRRLVWRAAGRPAPMGLFSSTACLSDREGSAIDQAAAMPRRLHIAVRSTMLGPIAPGDTPVLPLAAAEARAWRAAFADLSLIPIAADASRWRELADAIATGNLPPPVTREDARALWIESTLQQSLAYPLAELEAPLTVIARLGSALVAPSEPGWPRNTGLAETGRAPFLPLAERIERQLCARHGEEAVAMLPLAALLGGTDLASHDADRLVGASLSEGGVMTVEAAAALGIATAVPQRAAFRARPVTLGQSTALAIQHWGADAMSVLMGYAHLFEDVDAPAQLRAWIESFTGGADLAIGAPPAADRQSRLAPRRLTDRPVGPDDIAIDALDVAWDRHGTRLVPPRGAPIHRALHAGLIAEHEMPFAARLLLHLARPSPSVIELLLAATNRAMAGRIAPWLGDPAAPAVLALPEVRIEHVVLAPAAFALRCASPDWESVAGAWHALAGAGCRLGLAEIRSAGVLAEPRVVDLGTRDGITLALGEASGFVHLTPVAPAPDSRWLAEFCIELAAR